jgi:protocatechuate 3,4-dioxygenase beta subunit
MSSGMHGAKVIPPNAGNTTKLLGGEVSFTRVRTWYSEKGELRFKSMKPGVGIKRFFTRVCTWYSEKGELRFKSMKPGVGIKRFLSFTKK